MRSSINLKGPESCSTLRWYVEEKDYDYCLPDEEEYEDDNEQPAPKVPGF